MAENLILDIENGIPMPAERPGPGRFGVLSRTIMSLEVGQSFLLRNSRGSAILSNTKQVAERNLEGHLYTVRKLSPNKFRIWRIK